MLPIIPTEDTLLEVGRPLCNIPLQASPDKHAREGWCVHGTVLGSDREVCGGGQERALDVAHDISFR